MRQRLLRPGFAGGRPLWVDDPRFRLSRHVHKSSLSPGVLVCRRLSMDAPLWALYWWQDSRALRVLLVVHHVVADGMGGLAALASIVDGGPRVRPQAAHTPSGQELLRDAHQRRLRAIRRLPSALREVGAGLQEMGVGRPGLVPRSSILRPTSGTRHMAGIQIPVEAVVEAAHRRSATVNDLVLCAVAGALDQLLSSRGERPDEVVISVPVSARPHPGELGNQVGAIPIAVNLRCDREQRLAGITAATARAKAQKRGSSGYVLSAIFRALAVMRVGQFFVDHQRLVHTFETNLRGPETEVAVAGHRVRGIVPIAINPGNVGVSFDVLSYAGSLCVNVVACPRTVPEVEWVARVLRRELAEMAGRG